MSTPERPVTADDPRLLANMARIERMHVRYDYEIAVAQRTRQHLWAAFSMYKLTEGEVGLLLSAGEAGILSAAAVPAQSPDRLISVSVGCYLCEAPPSREVLDRPCPGEPAQ